MSIVSVAVGAGFGRPVSYLTPRQIVNALKWSVVSQLLTVLTLQIARISIAIFLIRIFSKLAWMRRFLYITTTINTCAAVAAVIVQFTQCTPGRRVWDRSVAGHCLSPNVSRDLEVFICGRRAKLAVITNLD